MHYMPINFPKKRCRSG